jgi:Mg2+ and Co2+ transporter CorA
MDIDTLEKANDIQKELRTISHDLEKIEKILHNFQENYTVALEFTTPYVTNSDTIKLRNTMPQETIKVLVEKERDRLKLRAYELKQHFEKL